MKIKELREMGTVELEKLVGEHRAKGEKLRFDIAAKQVKGHRVIRHSRRTVAQALTLLREKAAK